MFEILINRNKQLSRLNVHTVSTLVKKGINPNSRYLFHISIPKHPKICSYKGVGKSHFFHRAVAWGGARGPCPSPPSFLLISSNEEMWQPVAATTTLSKLITHIKNTFKS